MTNAVDTTTESLDLVVAYRHDFADGGRLRGTLAGNYTQTEFDRIAGTPAPLAALGITTPLFDLTQQLRFSDSLPGDKITLDLDYARGPFGFSLTTHPIRRGLNRRSDQPDAGRRGGRRATRPAAHDERWRRAAGRRLRLQPPASLRTPRSR